MRNLPERAPAERQSSPRTPEGPTRAVQGHELDGLGNRALLSLMRSGRLQRKARVSRPDDPHEHEADRAAEAVMSGRKAERPASGVEPADVARMATEDEARATAPGVGSKPRQDGPNPTVAEGSQVVGDLQGGIGLDGRTRALMESRFSESFDGVRIHADHRAGEAAESLRSRAFTVGESIVFAEGEYAPETTEGRRLLAHELAHVVQQRRAVGGVAAESQAERDAHEAANEVVRGGAPDVRERANPGTVQKQERPPDEIAMLEELKGLDKEAESATLSAEAEARRQELRAELARRDEERHQSRTLDLPIGPPAPDPVGPQPAPTPDDKHPHVFRVSVTDNELTATLNGNRVAGGWVADGSGVAFEENYSDDPLFYYVTLWIDGNHGVTHDEPGAVIEFRKVAEKSNFLIRQTSRSLGEHPIPPSTPPPPSTPRPSTPPPPKKVPKKKPPSVVVPPSSPTDDPLAPFLESDEEPPQAYFTPKVLKLREHMARGDSDVEDLATELSIPELRSLDFDERLRLIRQIADNWIVGDEKERTLNDLIDTTAEPDAARLLEQLRADDSALLRRLESVIDGEEYVQFHEALRRLYLRSMTPDQLLTRATEARGKAMIWADPGLINFFKDGGKVVYKITKNSDGTLHVRRWVSTPIPMGNMELPPLDLDLFELVAVYFKSGEDMLGGSKGSMVYMPADNLLMLENKAFKQDLELAANVGMVIGGGAGIVQATGRLALALAIAEVTVGAANITIDSYKSELEKTPEGAAFLRSWEVVNLLFAAYSVGKAIKSAPRAIRELRDAYQAFRAARVAMDPAEAARVEQEMARVLKQMDEVEKGLAEEAHGDINEPPSRPGPGDIGEGPGYDDVGPWSSRSRRLARPSSHGTSTRALPGARRSGNGSAPDRPPGGPPRSSACVCCRTKPT
jgi:hypothetical protein